MAMPWSSTMGSGKSLPQEDSKMIVKLLQTAAVSFDAILMKRSPTCYLIFDTPKNNKTSGQSGLTIALMSVQLSFSI
jgi:uncharacterized protein YbbK (DUF523 family)